MVMLNKTQYVGDIVSVHLLQWLWWGGTKYSAVYQFTTW